MFEVIVDTREQYPFHFSSSKISGTVSKKLDTGDYSITGLEDILCIERKASVVEFYNNITQKRFWAELERMKAYKYRFLVFEFSASEVEMFPYGADIPKSVLVKLKISSAYLMKCIARIQVEYDVHVIFGGNKDNALYLVTNIMKEVHVRHS
jgi:ERCC4-type nuclease